MVDFSLTESQRAVGRTAREAKERGEWPREV